MKPYGYVYLIRNRVNGKVYVGQTVQAVKRRWAQHISKALAGKVTHFSNAIRKYGKDAFDVITIATACDQFSLNLKERILIRVYRSMDKGSGYNRRDGGANGRMSEETKRKIGTANAGRLLGKKQSREFIEMRVSKIRGRKQTPEEIEKRACRLRGRKMTPAAIEANRRAQLGKCLSEEHRTNIKAGLKRFRLASRKVTLNE